MRSIGKYAAVAGLSAVVFLSSCTAYAEADATPPPDAKHGEAIFTNICSHCHHASFKDSAVGAPGLMDVLDRHTEEWIFSWLHNPAEFAKTDETAKALVQSNPYGLTMPTIPEMQDEQNRRDVIAFLKTLRSK